MLCGKPAKILRMDPWRGLSCELSAERDPAGSDEVVATNWWVRFERLVRPQTRCELDGPEMSDLDLAASKMIPSAKTPWRMLAKSVFPGQWSCSGDVA